jgi:TRAP-type C4-dicarboxylate transport system substrate-binding protein
MMKAILLAGLTAIVALAPGAVRAQQQVSVAGITFPDTITDRQWDVFIANVTQKSDPELSLKMMVRGEAGSEEMMIQAMRRGRLDMAAPSLAGATSLVPELSVLQLPFLFESQDQMDWIYDEVLPPVFRAAFADRDVIFLHWIDSGWLGFYGPVSFADPAAVAGIKLRTPPTDAARLTAEVLNADAIYVPYPEIVPALQTGLIEGGITSDYGFVTGGMAPEIAVFTWTKHAYDTGMLLANADWYASLSPQNRDMFLTAYGDTQDFRARSRAYTAGVLESLSDTAGTEVVSLSPAQRRRWADVTRPAHRKLLDRVGPAAEFLYGVIEEAKSRFDNVGSGEGELSGAAEDSAPGGLNDK